MGATKTSMLVATVTTLAPTTTLVPTTTTMAPTTTTMAPTTTPTVPTTSTTNLGCDTMCEFEGQSYSCKDRIAYASGHQFQGQDHACTSAYKLLQQQCPVCSVCSFDASGCSGPAPLTTPVTS